MYTMQARLIGAALALLVVVGIFAGLFFWGRSEGVKADAKRSAPIIAKLGDDLKVCQANEVTLRGAIDQRNADVQDWKAKATAAEKEAERLAAEARKASSRYLSDARRIASAPVTGDHCEWAAEFHVKTLEEERR